MKILPSDGSYSTFCDIVTGYRLASAIMQAVKSGIIAAVGSAGCTEAELLAKTGLQAAEGGRFLALLLRVGVLEKYADCLYLSQFSRKYLHDESDLNQLHVLEFEPGLMARWNGLGDVLRSGQGSAPPQPDANYEQRLDLFQQAMHEAAIVRAQELWSALSAIPETGLIIDIGAGDGTYLREFLRRYPRWRGGAVDLAAVVARIKDDRITTHACNLLEPAELSRLVAAHRNSATIVLLSNVIHCYSEAENSAILGRLQELVAPDGVVVVHDFFTDGNGFGALYDLHMMVNTYNGRGYSFAAARRLLAAAGFGYAELLELPSYSHALVATRQPGGAARGDVTLSLRNTALDLGFFAAAAIDPAAIIIEPWVTAKCQYGCGYYGRKWSCPPHSPGADEFRALLGCYTKAVLVVGQPPLAGFQSSLLELEKAAFLHGSKKALVFSGGPCSWCAECAVDRCRCPEKRRPSLEACGCDVFALAAACNVRLEPLQSRDDFVQYVGLLLVE